MVRVMFVSKSASACAHVRLLLRQHGFKYSSTRPDIVVTYGGDGTLLHAERLYPGVPKLPLRASATSKKCLSLTVEQGLDLLHRKRLRSQRVLKLEATIRRPGVPAMRLLGLNDVIVRNKNVEHAIRFDVLVDGVRVESGLIGDGVVVASPFGSSAYFRSVARHGFEKGIGIAFNNVTEQSPALLCDASVVVRVRLLRGPAAIASDNARTPIVLRTGETIEIRRAKRDATLLAPR